MGSSEGRAADVDADSTAAVTLYNLAEDPGEERDVAGANRAVVAKIEALMQAEHERSGEFRFGWEGG